LSKSTRAATLERLVGIDDIADALGVCRRTVERMKSAGEIPLPDKVLGRLPRWRTSTIERWMSGGK
jgi:predicted DNA-binding transcriptional regulator AlpA